jgi:1-phosphofructokinase
MGRATAGHHRRRDRLRERLRARGIELVVVSMGEEGALFLSDEGALLARLDAGPLASTVGAGDAMVAGLRRSARPKAPLERIARLATAFAVAKLGRAGPTCPSGRASSPGRRCRYHPSPTMRRGVHGEV